MTGYILTAIIFGALGHLVGWLKAHTTIATECKLLGKFYVNNDVYVCTKIIKNLDDVVKIVKIKE
jgi:hypothetical protein